MPKEKEIEVIDRGGAKTVAKKRSYVTRVNRLFAFMTVIWFAFVICFPLVMRHKYAQSIKKSIVVSMFYDLQHNIVEEYEKLLRGIKNAINLEKPIAFAIDKVKVAQGAVGKVTDTTAKVKSASANVKQKTNEVKAIAGFAGRLGINTSGIDRALNEANKGIATADTAVNRVDTVAQQINEKLDKVQKDLAKVLQIEFDKMIDAAIKKELDKSTGGLGTTLLTNYGVKHIAPWRPSTWRVSTKIYNDLARSNIKVITVITKTVDKYFAYVMWGIVIGLWILGFLIWRIAYRAVKIMVSPFIVCPRCGHTFTNKRKMWDVLYLLKPWKWLGI